jgi:hypothetical protein
MLVAMIILAMGVSCASVPPAPQQDLAAWKGASVEELDAHTFFKTVPMFRTKTDSGTEIRNYAYGYNFGECFGQAGASKFGDFVHENDFITCSSSRIVCNNIFYIKEEQVLEYAPTGRCDIDEKVLPERRVLNPKVQ